MGLLSSMGGYLFLTTEGRVVWRLNLGGAIVWYGLLEGLCDASLPSALVERHNWGDVWDATGYRELSQACIRNLAVGNPLPTATEAYRVKRKETPFRFRADALRIFQGSLRKLPPTGRFIAADDLNMDWLEEPCDCEICKTTSRPNPRALSQGYANRSKPPFRG
jgi:hypothetical protein